MNGGSLAQDASVSHSGDLDRATRIKPSRAILISTRCSRRVQLSLNTLESTYLRRCNTSRELKQIFPKSPIY